MTLRYYTKHLRYINDVNDKVPSLEKPTVQVKTDI